MYSINYCFDGIQLNCRSSASIVRCAVCGNVCNFFFLLSSYAAQTRDNLFACESLNRPLNDFAYVTNCLWLADCSILHWIQYNGITTWFTGIDFRAHAVRWIIRILHLKPPSPSWLDTVIFVFHTKNGLNFMHDTYGLSTCTVCTVYLLMKNIIVALSHWLCIETYERWIDRPTYTLRQYGKSFEIFFFESLIWYDVR